MSTPNYTPGVGGLATNRYDFEEHIEGTAFRHNAIQTDVNPAVTINGAQYITVADALNAVSGYIIQALANGQGFVTVGDGYDTYHRANGLNNFDSTIPSLDTLLNPIFQSIANAQAVLASNSLPFPLAPATVPPDFARIQYGGVIVIKAGTYIVRDMIQVPPGITILGEGYGTKLVNVSALNTSLPNVAPTPLTPIQVSVVTATNPAQITTLTTHGLSTGDYISISGVANFGTAIINNANTQLTPITVIDSFNFTLNGVSGNAAFPSSGTITSASNTTPIQITTSVVNTLQNGQTVIISGVGGNTAANGTWVITTINNQNFTLNTSIGNALYTSGGSVAPVPVVLTQNPVFFILPDNNRSVNDSAIDPNLFMFSRETKIVNLVIGDNFIEPTVLGDVYYKLPQNSTNNSFVFGAGFLYQQALPLIYQQSGSNLILDNVIGIGRVSFSSGTIVNSITATLVETATYPIIPNAGVVPTGGSILKINNCFIDGFSVPFIFSGLKDSLDFVNIVNSKIRAYGYLNGDNTATSNNTFLLTSDCNLNISNNHFYGNSSNMLSIVDFNSTGLSGAPALQAKSKVTSTNNNIIVNKVGTSTNNSFQFYTFGLIIASIFNYITIAGRPTIVSNAAPYNNTSPYSIEGSTPGLPYATVILVSTATMAWTINLPGVNAATIPVGPGQVVTIMDYTGNAIAHNITIVPPVGSTIRGPVSPVINSNYGSLTLTSFSDGSIINWFITQTN